MIPVEEVKQVTSEFFPARQVGAVSKLHGGFDFNVYRVEFRDGDCCVFKGKRACEHRAWDGTSPAQELASEVHFYHMVSHLPVPKVLHFEPVPEHYGFSFALYSYLSGRSMASILKTVDPAALRDLRRETGRYLGKIHEIRVGHIGRLFDTTESSWGAYVRRRLAERLRRPELDGLVTEHEAKRILASAAALPAIEPHLLHMDYWTANIVVDEDKNGPKLVGIVDGTNSIGGDRLFDFARMDGGKPVPAEFLDEINGLAKNRLTSAV